MNRARQFFWQAMQQLGLAAKPKPHRVQRAVDLFLERWAKYPGKPQPAFAKGGIGVVLTPWLHTAVPLYNLECARKLAASGHPVTIIWDPANIFDNAGDAWEVAQLERVIATVRGEFPVLSPNATPATTGSAPEFLAELIAENAVQRIRGEDGAAELLEARPELAAGMHQHAQRVRALLSAREFDWLLIPGGAWAVSGVYAGVAAELGLSVTTYDSGPGALFIGHNGVAAHFPDVAAVADRVTGGSAANSDERTRMKAAARRQLETRMSGLDEYRLQPVAASEEANGQTWDILVPLNLRWDSAALCRAKLFADVRDWLEQLLVWAEGHPTARIAIRQHPCEKIPEFRGTDDFSKLLARHPKLAGRAIYFSAFDTVNTYDLFRSAKVVLPFTSRVGIEAAMLGKPVVLGTKCYYASCGFTWNPATASEYFATISRALDGELVVSEQAREKAWITYYLAECCLELRTPFTPAPPDFEKWVELSPDAIWASDENQDLLAAFLTREPLVSIRYRRQATAARVALPVSA